ncbi:MAG: SppA protein [Proteobacteria bacterium]|nr:SppA protein [Pseudomonadota bacterium]
MDEEIQKQVNTYADEHDTDIVVYLGEIARGPDDYIIDKCRERKLRKNITLFLSTIGGDPNAAYRIAKCFQKAYKTRKKSLYDTHEGSFKIVIDGMCKSAGTLLCLGADELIMSGNAELGPIDVQLLKQDEVGERTSGLTPIQAVKFLESETEMMFKRNFYSLRFAEDVNFSTKMAAQIATDLTTGLLSPIFNQIDPIRLAEVDRSLRIAKEYGERLNNFNLREGKLDLLISGYPSHSFVIDREETKELFHKVTELTGELREISNYFRQIYTIVYKNRGRYFDFISSEPKGEG